MEGCSQVGKISEHRTRGVGCEGRGIILGIRQEENENSANSLKNSTAKRQFSSFIVQ